jgi:hypothetical protein
MDSNLSEKELNFIRQLIQNDENRQERTFLIKIIPFVNVVLGAALFIASALYFLTDPTIFHAKWVLLPGSIFGIILLLLGLLLSKENSHVAERKKITAILKKLVNDEMLKK